MTTITPHRDAVEKLLRDAEPRTRDAFKDRSDLKGDPGRMSREVDAILSITRALFLVHADGMDAEESFAVVMTRCERALACSLSSFFDSVASGADAFAAKEIAGIFMNNVLDAVEGAFSIEAGESSALAVMVRSADKK